MNNHDILFIRACKLLGRRNGSKRSVRRFRQLIRRLYLTEYQTSHVVNILSDICDKYNLCKTNQLVMGLIPSDKWRYDDKSTDIPMLIADGSHESNADYFDHALGFLTSTIAFSNVHEKPGFIKPAAFRK